jgi:hypothetical protein
VDEKKGADEREEGGPGGVAVVSAVPPPADEDDTQAFVRAYVKNYGIHLHFRWRDYHLQQLEAAGQEWIPKMRLRHGPVALKRLIMQWVRNQLETDKEEDAEQLPVEVEEVKMAE